MIKLIFCMQIGMNACYKLILWYSLDGQAVPQFSKIASLQCLYNISKFHTSWFQHFGHQSLLHGDIAIIDGHDQAFSKYS